MKMNIRKIVSVICAVTLLMSLCAVSFVNTSSAAITSADDITSVNSYETVVNYNFDNAYGIAYRRFVDDVSRVDGGLKIYNNGNGGGVWFAKDPSHNTVINHNQASSTEKQTAYNNLLKLDANTTYRVTFKYKYLAGSTKVGYVMLFAPDVTGTVDSTAPDFHTNSNLKIVTNVKNEATKPTVPSGGLTADTEVYNATFTFTVSDKSIHLGMRAEQNKCYMLVDDLKIEKVTSEIQLNDINKTYVFDYADESNQAQLTARQEVIAANSNKNLQHYSWYNWNGYLGSFAVGSSDYNKYNKYVEAESYPGKPGFTSEGAKFTVGKQTTLSDSESFGFWANNLPIFDPDIGTSDGWGNKGGYFMTKDEAVYLVTVKYKVTQLASTNMQLTLAATKNPTAGSISPLPGQIITITETSDDWQYYTAMLDTKASPAFADKLLVLTAALSQDTKWATVIVDSITVEEKRDTKNGLAIMKYNNRGVNSYAVVSAGSTDFTLPVPENSNPDSAFAGWYTSSDFTENTKVDMNGYIPEQGVNELYAKWVNTASKIKFNNQGIITEQKLAVGLELPNPVRPNANVFFEGWYSDLDFTNEITAVPDYDVTLYAKYNGVYLGFNNIIHPAGETSASKLSIVSDPEDNNNQIIKFETGVNSRPNFMIPSYDEIGAKGFELKTNTTYIITYRMKMTETATYAGTAQFLLGDKNGNSDTTTRSLLNGTVGDANSTEWTYITNVFTTGDTFYLERVKWSYQNHIFFSIWNQKNAQSVYVDDICIAEVLDKAPEGTVTVSFETNSTKLPNMYGYTGEQIPALSEPSLSGYEFVGWYTDKRLSNPFTALTFGEEDIVLYAKWKAVPFVVDFSDYEQGQKSERAEFVKDDNGNDYLDWYVEHATNNKHDVNTPYRVFLNKSGVHYTVDTGTGYTMTFKYKLLEGNVTVQAVANGKLNGWNNPKVHDEKITLNNVSDNWQTASLDFVALPEAGKYLSIGIAGHGHILVDDISVVATGGLANLYGSTAIFFNSKGGEPVDAISGDKGESIGKLPTATKKGYAFDKWYLDSELTVPFTDKVWGEEDLTLYAGWSIATFKEGFEDYPGAMLAQGISGGYKVYKDSISGYDKSNVKAGSVSLYRDGAKTGSKAFTLCRSDDLELTVGKQYTLTFYVKPEAIGDAAGTISLIGMDTNAGIVTPKSTKTILTVGNLKAGEWQKVTYTFTADNRYVGISSTAGNNMYLDDFTISLKGYVGTTTGDSSVNPMVIILMVVLAAGSLVFTGKKVFDN